MAKKKLLIVDDHEGVRQATRRAFERDFEVFEAKDRKEALSLYDSISPEAVFLDIDFYGFPEGWEVLREIRLRKRQAVVVLVTGLSRPETHPLFSLADGYFPKPSELKDMQSFLREKGLLSSKKD